MVLELLEFTEPLALAGETFVAGGHSGSVGGLLGAGLVGGILGAVSPTQNVALMSSLAAGAVVPLVSGSRASVGSLALSMVTSTAVGLVAHKWAHKHSHREDARAAQQAQPQR